MKYVKKNIVMIVLCTITLALLIMRLIKCTEINKNPVFVVGVVKKIEDLASSFSYICEYSYNGEKYYASFSGVIPKGDSLMFFKISKDNPQLWELIENVSVPKCITVKKIPDSGWTHLPACADR